MKFDDILEEIMTETVKKTKDGRWVVAHCKGKDKGEPIKSTPKKKKGFATKKKALAQHRAIWARRSGG